MNEVIERDTKKYRSFQRKIFQTFQGPADILVFNRSLKMTLLCLGAYISENVATPCSVLLLLLGFYAPCKML